MVKKAFDIDDSYITTINEKFLEKRTIAAAKEKQLFGVFEQNISDLEEAALKFIYAYMPLNDMADYDGGLFLQHVRKTLNIRNKTPWGEKIPDSVFLHFVLPYRVNNENIEDSREILFNELFDRVRNLSMYDAILEVNHWCHEKATYIGSNPRTSSPLTVIRTALGRCGEQSTLAVAALRSLCIPARQCYTPRWAHCDSNHAWVEAWADGKWYFFGACEPEPRLNLGWFTGPARRAMLVNTRVPANYPGPEEITLAHKWYTEINLLNNYSANKKITVCIKDEKAKPVEGAKVSFEVYNFAEFSPIARLTTGPEGTVSLTTGLGDLMLHASSDKGWGFKKISVKDADSYELVISDKLPVEDILELDMVPPPEVHLEEDKVSEEERQINNSRLKEEDRIRAEYEATFVSEKESEILAKELNLPSDRIWNIIKKSRGNSREIAAFLKEETEKYGEWPLKLLESVTDKDLKDTFRPVLKDHLTGALPFAAEYDNDIFTKYILCPRAGLEMIGEYRGYFQHQFAESDKKDFKQNPKSLAIWIGNNIDVMEDYTYYQGAARPRGSFEIRKADRQSRNILFVAMARSFGIPARLEPTDKRPQFLGRHGWLDACFEFSAGEDINAAGRAEENNTTGVIKFTKEDTYDGKVGYFMNFTLARFDNGKYRTLDYHHTEFSELEEGITVPAGYYRLMTGNRLSDGTVLTRVTSFSVKPYDTVKVDLVFRTEEKLVPILGTAPENCRFTLLDGRVCQLADQLENKSAVIAWIEPDREPSKHLIRELCELKNELNESSCSIYICTGEEKITPAFTPDAYSDLPVYTEFAVDFSYKELDSISCSAQKENLRSFPVVFIVDSCRNIRYASSGYKLGTGMDIINTLKII